MYTHTVCVFDCRNSAQGSEHEVYPTIQMRHAALERNKRCLLTYLYVRYSEKNPACSLPILITKYVLGVLWLSTELKYK